MIKNFKFSTQIILGYLIVLILMIVVGSVALVRLNQINSTFIQAERWAIEQQSAGEILSQVLRLRFYANKYILDRNQAHLERFNEIWTELEEMFFSKEEVTKLTTSNERIQSATQLKQLIQEYKIHFQEVTQLIAERSQIISEILDIQGPLAEDKLEQLHENTFKTNDTAGSYRSI